MIERWMYSVIVLSALVAIGGSFLVQLTSRFGLARRWIWIALMVLSVALPISLSMRTRQTPLTTHPFSGGSAAVVATGEPAPAHEGADARLLFGWAAASLVLAGLFAASHRRLRSELAGCPRRTLFGASVCVSPDFGPAATGLLRTVIVLPEWVFDLPASEQQMVLRHELEHVRAGDRFVLLTGVTLAVLMPWNLGLWWQLRALRVGMEVDCDARVAPTQRDRPRYAQLLLRARNRRQVHRLALALVTTSSALAQRLVALLDDRGPSRRRLATWAAAACGCAVVMTRVPVPGLAPLLAHAAPIAGIPPAAAAPLRITPTGRAVPELPPALASGGRKSVALRRAAAVPTASRAVVAQPRYDSLIPYVPGSPTMARGSYSGGGRGGGVAVRAVPLTPPDSGLHQPGR